nr:MAG TPA: hypothetical protein [Caudoviricetes sp.]
MQKSRSHAVYRLYPYTLPWQINKILFMPFSFPEML